MFVTKDLIKEQFEKDLLYMYLAAEKKTKDIILPDFLEKLHTQETYSTTKIAKYIGKTDAVIRNYYRNPHIEAYIGLERVGRIIRLDYKAAYRTYMVTIMVQMGKQLKDVESLLGVRPGVRTSNPNVTDVAATQNNQLLAEHVTSMTEYYNKSLKVLYAQDELRLAERELDRNKLQHLELENSKLSLMQEINTRKSEFKQQQLLRLALKKSNTSNGGFFASLFKKQETVDTDTIVNEALDSLNSLEEIQGIYKDKLQEIELKLQENKNEKVEIEKKIQQKEINLKALDKQLSLRTPSEKKEDSTWIEEAAASVEYEESD
ncbi:coiled-coil domain-containing protein [Alkalihalophilus marmarensis]|uniref:hypothetical protein n=1 Tax=Alkalihalophilus marmarensis TaxID=521377 RepID=UPI002DBED71F|nr:hypothetical protein [Alkalihalophilus marmarensis]MEC2074172.1 hypothetical protein [Alkalihalophilus marmarensis]